MDQQDGSGGELVLDDVGSVHAGSLSHWKDQTLPTNSGLFLLKCLIKVLRSPRMLTVEPIGKMFVYISTLLLKNASTICFVRLAWTLALVGL